MLLFAGFISGSDGTLTQLAYDMAAVKGFKIPFENVAIFGSHSHSGPGAISPEMLWAFAPATDLLVPGMKVIIDYVIIVHFRTPDHAGNIHC